MAITPYSIVTLVFFFVSTVFVIRPVSIRVPFPFIGRRRLTLGLTWAPILTIALLWAAQCLGPDQIRNGIVGTDNIKPYNILILFISLAYMAITLDVTGILRAAAFHVSNVGGSKGRKLYFMFFALLTVISMIIGNDPVILSGTVFLVYYAKVTNLDSEAWLIAEFAAANTASMVLFVGNPTNVVICEGFRINNATFTLYTIVPFLFCITALYGALYVQFRNRIPKDILATHRLEPSEVLDDPVGAIFGSVWLFVCLVVVIVTSFFHVDVWIIVLPFAFGKFIWDIVWDSYRLRTGKIKRYDPLNPPEAPEVRMERILIRQMSTEAHQGVHRRNTRGATVTSFSTLHENTFPPFPRTESPTHDESMNTRNDTQVSVIKEPEDKASGKYPNDNKLGRFLNAKQEEIAQKYVELSANYPTFFEALPRLPFGLIPFAFAQFILIEALDHQGWIQVFSRWLIIASRGGSIHAVVWLVGVFGVILCNISGTNIGATILLTKIVRSSAFTPEVEEAAAVALAVASNIGAVSFTFSASLAGLLWDSILIDKGVKIKQRRFAKLNALPLLVMTAAGLGCCSIVVVTVEELRRVGIAKPLPII
ncbi:hypothetical protein FA15DRAFT_631986 [Coprinopsis marcescibilis]|uniref:Citrate transporter-like domain-containing protein n=1 Tax=Coprinopsis marcescibilis TaxID=230819 RepID=A0A5C3LA46_COPMA|nr:hypothetical protein FA15DRAFT_631986 [Coprinopsis marcescibilis]